MNSRRKAGSGRTKESTMYLSSAEARLDCTAIAARLKGFSVIVADGSGPFMTNLAEKHDAGDRSVLGRHWREVCARRSEKGFRSVNFVQDGSQFLANFRGAGLFGGQFYMSPGRQMVQWRAVSLEDAHQAIFLRRYRRVQLREENIVLDGSLARTVKVARSALDGLESGAHVGQCYDAPHYRVKPCRTTWKFIGWKAQRCNPIGDEEFVVRWRKPALGC